MGVRADPLERVMEDARMENLLLRLYLSLGVPYEDIWRRLPVSVFVKFAETWTEFRDICWRRRRDALAPKDYDEWGVILDVASDIAKFYSQHPKWKQVDEHYGLTPRRGRPRSH